MQQLGAAAAVLISLGVALAAQQPGAPRFRSATHYVRLDVVVTDGQDQPVRGLTRDDFTITERGRPQVIADFDAVHVPVNERVVDLSGPVPVSSDVATNGASPADGRALAVVVDDTVLKTEDIAYVKRVLSSMLGTLSAGDYVAFTYVRRSDLSRDFTNDAVQHVRAVNQLTNAIGLPGVSPRYPERDLLVSLENVIKVLGAARQPRRSIILIGTRGCNPRAPGLSPIPDMCRAVIARANEVGAPIYAIDPTGELSNPNVEDPLQILAAATGGIRYRESQPWLSPARAMTDNGSYYLLGYYPDPLRNDGKFQPVEVTVTRPGVYVRARKGYVAPWWRQVATTPSRAMTSALGEGLPNPDLPIRAFVAPMPAVSGRARALLTVEVLHPRPPAGFSGMFSDAWRLGVLGLDADGRVKSSFQRPVTFTGTWRPGATGRIVLNEVIDLPTQVATVRVGITSDALGKTGTAHAPVVVPDFTKRDLQLGGLVIGYEHDVVDAIIGVDRIGAMIPIQPTTRRIFAAGERLRVFTRATWEAPDGVLTFELGLVGAGAARTFTVPGEPVARNRQVASLNQTLQLDGVAPGSHVLRLTARLPGGEPIVRQVPIEVR